MAAPHKERESTPRADDHRRHNAPQNRSPACPNGSRGLLQQAQNTPQPQQKEPTQKPHPQQPQMHHFRCFQPPKAPGIERFVSSASARMGIHAGHASHRPGKTDPRLAPQLLPWSLYIPLSHFFITSSRLIACDYFSLITANGLHRFVTITDSRLHRFVPITANGLRHV